MIRNDISVVFFGTGPVASKSLETIAANFFVELIITKPKPDHHKGTWPVADLAKKLGLKIYYAKTKQEVETAILRKPLASKVGVVIDFGVLISEKTIEQFQFGIINSHFSLLPRHRGADPITFAILRGDKKTGVSLMKIVPKMDKGPLIEQRTLYIDPKTDSRQLTKQLVELSNVIIKDSLPKYMSGEIQVKNQPSLGASYTRKLKKLDGLIDWSRSAKEIERQIRAYSEWPRSRTKLGGVEFIITEAEIVNEAGKAGEYIIKNNEFVIFCGEKALKINKLQPSGKKEMAASDFLRGYQNRLNLG